MGPELSSRVCIVCDGRCPSALVCPGPSSHGAVEDSPTLLTAMATRATNHQCHLYVQVPKVPKCQSAKLERASPPPQLGQLEPVRHRGAVGGSRQQAGSGTVDARRSRGKRVRRL